MSNFNEVKHYEVTVSAEQAMMLNAVRHLNDPRRKKEAATGAVSAFFALEFSDRAITGVGRDKLTQFFNRIKAARLPMAAFRRLADHIAFGPLRASAAIHFHFEEWRQLIYRFDLVESVELPGWIPALNALASHLLRTPTDLALLKRMELNDISASVPDTHPVLPLWKGACIFAVGPGAFPPAVHPLISSVKLASSFR